MVWCSGWRLASAVSNAGGLGLLGAGSMHPDTLREHIQKCRKATDRPFGVNVPLMYPQIDEIMNLLVEEEVKIVFTSAGNPKLWTPFLKEHGMTVVHVVSSSKFARKCEEAGVDAVVSGAGLPLELPGIVGTKEVAIAPIVSSARAAKLILRRWAKGFDRTADFVVIEGCKAGGHLGFAEEDLLADRCQTLDEILPGVLAEVKPYEEQYGHAIPVFVAGGVYTGADMAHFTKLGAAGVQLATRFIPTYECDASQTYKDVLLAAKPEDVRIIHSPVGMPGRALNTPLVQALAEGKRFPPKHCARCLKTCDPAAVPYCITHALIEAVKGNVEEGLFFCGENVGRLDRMRTVRELMDELVTEWRQNL